MSAIIWIVMLFFYSKDTYIYTTGITLLGKKSISKQIVIDMYRYAIGVTGVIAVIFWTKLIYCLINKYKYKYRYVQLFGKIFENLGANSLAYYILSTYFFAWIVPIVTESFQLNYFVVFIETVAVLILCSAMKNVLSKFEKVSYFIIGK